MPRFEGIEALERIFNGNPAMAEIFWDAIDRLDEGIPLSEVQQVVLREWAVLATVEATRIREKGTHTPLSDNEYADLAAIEQMLVKITEGSANAYQIPGFRLHPPTGDSPAQTEG